MVTTQVLLFLKKGRRPIHQDLSSNEKYYVGNWVLLEDFGLPGNFADPVVC